MNTTEVKSEMETKIENFINTFKSEQSDFENVKENMMQLFFEMHNLRLYQNVTHATTLFFGVLSYSLVYNDDFILDNDGHN